MRSCFHQLALEKYLPSPDSESLTDNSLSPSISWPWPTIFWACLADPSILKFSLLSTLGWYLPYFIVFLWNNNLYTINMEFLFLLIEGGMNSPRFLKTWRFCHHDPHEFSKQKNFSNLYPLLPSIPLASILRSRLLNPVATPWTAFSEFSHVRLYSDLSNQAHYCRTYLYVLPVDFDISIQILCCVLVLAVITMVEHELINSILLDSKWILSSTFFPLP